MWMTVNGFSWGRVCNYAGRWAAAVENILTSDHPPTTHHPPTTELLILPPAGLLAAAAAEKAGAESPPIPLHHVQGRL